MGRGSEKKVLKTKNKKKATLLEVLRRIFFLVSFGGFAVFCVWVLIFSTVMKIDDIEIVGAIEDSKEIEEIVLDEINKKYFEAIPKNNLLTIPAEKIIEDIEGKFKLIRDVEIKRVFPKRIIIKTERRKIAIAWCEINKECALVDERAEKFFKFKSIEDTKAFEGVIAHDGSGREIEMGARVIRPQVIEICDSLFEIVRRDGGVEIDIRSIYIPSPMAEELRVETRDGWRVYFSTARTIETQAKVLREIIDDKITEDNIAQLEYIDLRIKGKASFRFKDYKRREELKRELEDKLESLETKVLGAQKKKEKKKKKKE